MEDFITWTDTSAIRKHVLEYNEMVSYRIKPSINRYNQSGIREINNRDAVCNVIITAVSLNHLTLYKYCRLENVISEYDNSCVIT